MKDGKLIYKDDSQTSQSPNSAFDSPNNTTPIVNNQGLEMPSDFKIKNGCCRECMKAFSTMGKACLCQVPIK